MIRRPILRLLILFKFTLMSICPNPQSEKIGNYVFIVRFQANAEIHKQNIIGRKNPRPKQMM